MCGLGPQMKTPPESNPGFPGLEVWGQAYLVGSRFTLLSKVNNCTTHPVGRKKGPEHLRLLFEISMSPIAALIRVVLCLPSAVSAMGRAKATPTGWSSNPSGMTSPHFSSFLTGKFGRSNAILHRSQQQGLLQGNEELGVRKLPWEITYGAVESLRLSNMDHRRSWSTGDTSLCQVP